MSIPGKRHGFLGVSALLTHLLGALHCSGWSVSDMHYPPDVGVSVDWEL